MVSDLCWGMLLVGLNGLEWMRWSTNYNIISLSYILQMLCFQIRTSTPAREAPRSRGDACRDGAHPDGGYCHSSGGPGHMEKEAL